MSHVSSHSFLANARDAVSLLMVAAAGVALFPLSASAQDLRQVSAAIATRLETSSRKSVAVIDFTDLDGNVTELGRFLAEELSVALFADAKSYAVVDRTHLKALLKEQKLSSTGLIDPQTARQLGKVAGVDTIVTGSLTSLGDSVRVAVKALDTETARMIAATTVDVPRTGAITSLGDVLSPGSTPVTNPTNGRPPRRPPAPATVGAAFENDGIAMSARAAVSHDGAYWQASVTLLIENISAEEQYLAVANMQAALSDPQARTWNRKDIVGLPSSAGTPSVDRMTRLPAGGKQTVILTFYAPGQHSPTGPASFAVTLMCWRRKGATVEQLSVGLPDVAVAK